MIDNLKKQILTLAKVMGEPMVVRVGVKNKQIQILTAEKYENEEESATLDTHIDIRKPLVYIG